jgi:hypothetical protein
MITFPCIGWASLRILSPGSGELDKEHPILFPLINVKVLFNEHNGRKYYHAPCVEYFPNVDYTMAR